jgi:hypothetical protein
LIINFPFLWIPIPQQREFFIWNHIIVELTENPRVIGTTDEKTTGDMYGFEIKAIPTAENHRDD